MAATPPIPLGAWTPDQPDYRGPGLIEARNCLPREDGFYGPARSFSAYTAALAARARGGIATRDVLNSTLIFVGTAAALYKLGSDNAWSTVGSDYAMSAEDRWSWTTYSQYLIGVGGLNVAPQVWDLSGVTGGFAALSSTAPNARHAASINDFVVLGHTYTPDAGVRQNRLWWSAKGDPTNWPTPATNEAISVESSYRDIPDGGAIMGVLGGVGGADGAVFGESRIWRVTYVGPKLIFQIDPVERSRGVYASGSLVQVGRMAYYLAEDGFFAFDGVQSVPIGAGKWDRTILDDLDDSNRSYVWSAVDTASKVIMWAYPGANNTDGLPNRIFVWNYVSDRAALINLECEMLISLASQGYTLDSLDTLGYTLDTLPFSLDSRAWAGGGKLIATANAGHVIGQFAGPTLQADFTTSEWSLPTHDRAFVNGGRVVGDTRDVEMAFSYREDMGEDSPVTTTSYTPRGADRWCRNTFSARYARSHIRVPAGEDWTSIQAVQLDAQPDGEI